MPQDFAVYDDLSVLQNLEFFGELYSLRRGQVRERANELLALVELSDRKRQRSAHFPAACADASLSP